MGTSLNIMVAWEEMIAAHDAWANSCSGDKQQYIKDRRPFVRIYNLPDFSTN
jgi:hypothetical protein